MSNGHATLSPSGAHRWMTCPGSVTLERDQPDDGNDYSDEGTCAHALANAAWLEGRDPHAYIGRRFPVAEHRTWEVDEEMADEVAKYLAVIKALSVNGNVRVECKVPIGHITGEEGATGTSDVIIIDEQQKELICVDLKYGRGVRVVAKDNPQLLHYLVGAYDEASLTYDIERVRSIVHQPRLDHLDEEAYTIEQLEEFRKKAQTRAAVALSFRDASVAEACMKPEDDGIEFTFLHPSDAACQFCKAKATCPALEAKVKHAIGATFEDLSLLDEKAAETQTKAVVESTSDIGVKMDCVDLIEMFCKAVRAKVDVLLRAGQAVMSPKGGYKLVKGRKGSRAWVDADEAEKMLKGFRLKEAEMYTYKVISPTAAEKLLKEQPKRWAKLNVKEVISQSEGALSVAPMGDKRPAEVIAQVVHENLEEDLVG